MTGSVWGGPSARLLSAGSERPGRGPVTLSSYRSSVLRQMLGFRKPHYIAVFSHAFG